MNEKKWQLPIGANVVAGGVRFRVWAPGWSRVEVVLYGPDAERLHPLTAEADGYWAATVEGAGTGTRYRFRFDEGESYPDPASRSQPDGVHGPSEVVDPAAYPWGDNGWEGLNPERLAIYELHVGTFTPEGTFAAAIERLDHVRSLGVTAVQVMPIAGFAGDRNWGYDGVNLYAPAAPYGGAAGFRRFVDSAHARGLGVILDVVYNHLGPEGNYLPAITRGRFFTDRHKTPWGDAVNYDGEQSQPVRDFVLHNALHWAHEYHVDGLRLDATHAIVDDSPRHLLAELTERLHALRPRRVLIAEDERNERRLVTPVAEGGLGLDAVWADDLHHQLRRQAAGDEEGYFRYYSGSVADIAETLRRGWFYQGEPYGPESHPRGTPAEGVRPSAFVHCIQNHDQVGNRALGTRLNHDVEPALHRALAALLLTSPYTPMLWMGEEWAATSPFLYFTDHPEELGRLVTEGRREEFKHFSAFQDPEQRERIPDPQADETFRRSKLRWDEMPAPVHAGTLNLYRELLRLRREEPALRARSRDSFAVHELSEGALALRRTSADGDLLTVINFRGEVRTPLQGALAPPDGRHWRLVLGSEEGRFGGSGSWGRLEDDELHLTAVGSVVLGSGRRTTEG